MIIQFNSDTNITGRAKFSAPIIALISKKLSTFNDKISRLEVHLSDEVSDEDGLNDKRCMLEARFAGMQPVAVTNRADSHEKAVGGAIEMLSASLNNMLGYFNNYR